MESFGFFVSKSTDGGKTFTNVANSTADFVLNIWLDITAASETDVVVTGLFNTKFTTNGEAMEGNSAGTERLISQSIEKFGDKNQFIGMVGERVSVVEGNQQGYAISEDGGKSFEWHGIPQLDVTNPATGFAAYDPPLFPK